MGNRYALTKEQRQEYSRHLMPCLRQPGGVELKGGHGIYFEDTEGKRYMDFTSEQFVCLLGFGNEEIAEAIYEQALNMPVVAPLHQTDLRYTLYHKMAEIAPEHLNRLSFTIGGGPAIETAMKIALKNVPESDLFITLYGGYHGTTFGTAAGSFISGRGGTEVSNPEFFRFAAHAQRHFLRVERPYCYRCPWHQQCGSCSFACAEAVRETILHGAAGVVAAVIVEPIQSGGGQIPLPPEYLKKLREICTETGTLLIFDEIQTYCRTGHFFAADYYSVEPDILVFAKGAGGGMPMGGVLIHDRLTGFTNLMEDMQTFQNNHMSYAAALKTIEIIERDHLHENTRRVGTFIMDRLRKMQENLSCIGDIRGAGLAIGVELVRDQATREPLDDETMHDLFLFCKENGLFFQTAHNVVKLKPPIIIRKEQAEEAMDILERALRRIDV